MRALDVVDLLERLCSTRDESEAPPPLVATAGGATTTAHNRSSTTTVTTHPDTSTRTRHALQDLGPLVLGIVLVRRDDQQIGVAVNVEIADRGQEGERAFEPGLGLRDQSSSSSSFRIVSAHILDADDGRLVVVFVGGGKTEIRIRRTKRFRIPTRSCRSGGGGGGGRIAERDLTIVQDRDLTIGAVMVRL